MNNAYPGCDGDLADCRGCLMMIIVEFDHSPGHRLGTKLPYVEACGQ